MAASHRARSPLAAALACVADAAQAIECSKSHPLGGTAIKSAKPMDRYQVGTVRPIRFPAARS